MRLEISDDVASGAYVSERRFLRPCDSHTTHSARGPFLLILERHFSQALVAYFRKLRPG